MARRSKTNRIPFAAFRARAAKLGLQVSWLMLAAILFAAYRFSLLNDPKVWVPSLLAGTGLLALSFIRWERALKDWRGDLFLWLWLALILAELTTVGAVRQLSPVIFALYFGVVVLSAALAGTVPHAFITGFVITSYILTDSNFGQSLEIERLVIPLVTFVAVAIASSMLTKEFRRETFVGIERVQQLAKREADLGRLYEVSKTMAAGDSLDLVLPELVGRIGRYLNAEVGAVLLHNERGQFLEVVSPIWTAGHALDVGGYRMSLNRKGDIERVFLSGIPALYTNLDQDPDSHGLLGELGTHSAMVVPMQLEHRTMGVMVLADKADGEFTRSDLEVLTSLAAPAALVLAQLERFYEAAETSRRMEELARMKSDFVSVVSHELRTPLTSIIGALATIARPELAPEQPAAQELLESARNQADRLRRLIEDLLVVSRIEGQALPRHPEEVDLSRFLPETIAVIAGADEVVRVQVAPNTLVKTDPDHVRRIVINLVENAMKHAAGSPIEVVGSVTGDRATIDVVDHGPGIPPSERAKIFDQFTQLEPSATRSRGGTGLGLNIVRGLAQDMEGDVIIHDTAGGGTTFRVDLPRVLSPRRGRRSPAVVGR
ncbi:MAG: ATP-binding protein [Acidimicrobiia bacterium]|nr:ATP-binding protein [Acidimicrobiia bacterium]MDH5615469.1 ATP-binding protein [Acidimicrobiia bacterium]